MNIWNNPGNHWISKKAPRFGHFYGIVHQENKARIPVSQSIVSGFQYRIIQEQKDIHD